MMLMRFVLLTFSLKANFVILVHNQFPISVSSDAKLYIRKMLTAWPSRLFSTKCKTMASAFLSDILFFV